MDPQSQADAIKWMFTSFIGVLLVILWWGFRAFLRDMREREEQKIQAQAKRDATLELRDKELQGCIDSLRESIWGLRDLFVLRKDYDRDMEDLREGRRISDKCPYTDCPLKDKPPGSILLTGSGAKRIAPLLEAAQREGRPRE